jgi:hypothetical protein
MGSAKAVQHGFCATAVELENRSAASEVDVASRASSAEKGGSVQIAGRISRYPALGPTPVRKVTRAVKWIKLSECLCRRRLDHEDSWQKCQEPNQKNVNPATLA